MSKYIDVDVFIKSFREALPGLKAQVDPDLTPKADAYLRGGEAIIEDLTKFPAADVVEVVRCKDCKWYSELVCGEGKLLGSQGWCNEVMARPMPSNGFCSFGERENNG